jgi:hypothetical protein
MALKFNMFSFVIKSKQVYLGDNLVIDLSNSWFTPKEVIRYLVVSKETKKIEHAIRTGTVADFLEKSSTSELIFPELLAKWMTEYGYETNFKGWLKFEEDLNFNRLPKHPVKEDISCMSPQKVRAFVRKHGLRNIEHYHVLRTQLMRIDDPNDSYYSFELLTPAARQWEKKVAWYYAALRITGLDHEDAYIKLSRMYLVR